jgi:hypothetical protein
MKKRGKFLVEKSAKKEEKRNIFEHLSEIL